MNTLKPKPDHVTFLLKDFQWCISYSLHSGLQGPMVSSLPLPL